MTRTQELKQRMNGNSSPAPAQNVNTLLSRMKQQFQAALPRHIPIERFMRVGLTEIRKNPKLGECDPITLIGALMSAAQDGLEPGLDGQCYLIPRWSGKSRKLEVSYQRGYQGILELARRSGEYSSILVKTVHENDRFDYEEGSRSFLNYKRNLDNRGKTIAYFAFTKLKSGEESFTIISVEEAEEHRNKFATSKNKQGQITGPWKDDFDSMAMKTVLIKHFKYQPKSTEIKDLAVDEKVVKYDEATNGLIEQHPEQPVEQKETKDKELQDDDLPDLPPIVDEQNSPPEPPPDPLKIEFEENYEKLNKKQKDDFKKIVGNISFADLEESDKQEMIKQVRELIDAETWKQNQK